jgi:hypothetical protein
MYRRHAVTPALAATLLIVSASLNNALGQWNAMVIPWFVVFPPVTYNNFMNFVACLS